MTKSKKATHYSEFKPEFALGRILITSNARERLADSDVQLALQRHHAGDWGSASIQDQQENELSLTKGFRLLSVYESENGATFWVITEGDRAVTTVLMPEDY